MVVLALIALLAVTGCGAPSQRSDPGTVGPPSRGLPLVQAEPETDWTPARLAAADRIGQGVSGGDLSVVSDRPEVPEAWWETHDAPPYKMMHLELDEGGATPGHYECFPAVESEDETWTCELIEPDTR